MAKKKSLDELKAALAKQKELLDKEGADKDKIEKAIEAIQKQIEAAEKAEADAKAKKEAAEKAAKEKAEADAKAKKELYEFYKSTMDKHKVDELYVNDKKEVFTVRNYADLSVKDKKCIKTVTREIVESLI